MRLFLGAVPDAATRAALAASIRGVRHSLGDLDSAFRWTPEDNLHVTLHFLGELAGADIERLGRALDAPLGRPPFEAETGAIGWFPPRRPPSAVFIGMTRGAAELVDLHARLAAALRRGGFETERRPFVPHITIARLRDRERRRVRSPDPLVATALSPARWRVKDVTLLASDLSGGAPRYTPQRILEL
jgi:2'-5' RNA ligase